MSNVDCLHHLLLGEFVHYPFHHRHRLLRSGDSDLYAALFLPGCFGVNYQLAVFLTDLHSGNRASERGL